MSIDPELQLKTRRCILRHLTEADIEHSFSASRVEGVNEGMVWDPPGDQSELIEPYRNNCKAWKAGEAYEFAIESHEGRFIGRVSIRRTKTDGLWNIGFWTHPEVQGRGFMTEAAKRVIEFGFCDLEAEEVEACHASWNKASQRVLEKCGMVWREHIEEGFLRRRPRNC